MPLGFTPHCTRTITRADASPILRNGYTTGQYFFNPAHNARRRKARGDVPDASMRRDETEGWQHWRWFPLPPMRGRRAHHSAPLPIAPSFILCSHSSLPSPQHRTFRPRWRRNLWRCGSQRSRGSRSRSSQGHTLPSLPSAPHLLSLEVAGIFGGATTGAPGSRRLKFLGPSPPNRAAPPVPGGGGISRGAAAEASRARRRDLLEPRIGVPQGGSAAGAPDPRQRHSPGRGLTHEQSSLHVLPESTICTKGICLVISSMGALWIWSIELRVRLIQIIASRFLLVFWSMVAQFGDVFHSGVLVSCCGTCWSE
jgi:hypothetical protein